MSPRRPRIEAERASSSSRLPPWTKHEHLARYQFAATYAEDRDVVDCACGDGTCAELIAAAGARRVQGFDLSVTAVAEAADASRSANVEFAVADATSLPVPNGSADLFVSLETIEHLDDERRFLDEVVRVLRPTGTFICSTPDRDVYSPGHDLGSRPWNTFHVREHSEADFADLLGSYFGDVILFGQNAKSAGMTELQCLLGRRLPADLMVRANQVAKLRRFLYDRLERHVVEPLRSGSRYEFVVAVCTGPHPVTR